MGVFQNFRYFNLRLGLSVLLIAISSFNYGFDNQAFALTQAMDSFDRKFGVYNEKTQTWSLETYWLSLFNSLNYIGFAAGVMIGSTISARWGRRCCMFSMSCYALVTATISVTSNSREQIMAARILNYVYIGMELSVVPVFQSEIVPAEARAFVVGTYQLSLGVGGLIINLVCSGTSHLSDDRAWRIPLGLFYIVPSIILSLIFFVPESPRWLLRQDRVEEAKDSLRRLRVGVFTNDEIDTEFSELQFSLEKEVEQGRFIELFRGVNLKRTGIVVACNFFQQATGQAFASQYGAIYMKSLQTLNVFALTPGLAAIGIVVVLTVILLSDRFGRRPFLMISSVVMMAGHFTMGGLGTAAVVTTPMKKGIVAAMVIFSAGFSAGWAPLTYVVVTEIVSLRLRDMTSRLGFFVNVLFNFTVSFSVPYMIAALNSKVGFIFGPIAFLALVFTYFCVPECKGKTLEEVDLLFIKGIKLKDFGRTDAAAMIKAELAAREHRGNIELMSTDVEKVGNSYTKVVPSS